MTLNESYALTKSAANEILAQPVSVGWAKISVDVWRPTRTHICDTKRLCMKTVSERAQIPTYYKIRHITSCRPYVQNSTLGIFVV